MKSDSRMRRPYFLGRGFVALLAVLVLVVAGAALPAGAAPFAYVTNASSNTVSVIDTATNTVVATVPVGNGEVANPFLFPSGVAVTPDGKHTYVTNASSNTVSVIDTATNTVVATVPVGINPYGVAIAPDGKRAYVANANSNTVSVIDTATNTVVATVLPDTGPIGVAITPDGKYAYVTNINSGDGSVIDTTSNTVVASIGLGGASEGGNPDGIAITPDGKHAYVTHFGGSFSSTVSVIDTATNTVVATLPAGTGSAGVAVTPDGKHAYVTGGGCSVIDTATNTVVATVPVGTGSLAVAITPDGKHAYIANFFSNNVSVIDTTSNTVVATVPAGIGPSGVGIVPPPLGLPFSAFTARLAIDLDRASKKDRFELQLSFTLGSASNGINPPVEPVTLKVGTFTTIIPPGSFKIADDQDDQNDQEEGVGMKRFGPFRFRGVIDGVDLRVLIRPTGAKRYALEAEARHADLTGTENPVPVTLTIGGDSGTTLVKAYIDQKLAGRDGD